MKLLKLLLLVVADWLPVRAALVLLLALTLIFGCALSLVNTPFGDMVIVIGDASTGCTYSEDGYLLGGSDCVAGGEMSPQAAAVAGAAVEPDPELE